MEVVFGWRWFLGGGGFWVEVVFGWVGMGGRVLFSQPSWRSHDAMGRKRHGWVAGPGGEGGSSLPDASEWERSGHSP